ncbi:hypothetical protein N7532_010701 [Penicillium argentinense]|uniref:Arylsulfotransferase n=1 Tax=Penicillium argentinense TaxID=1131581 RepID=A0A9W9EQB4_9EURO|nr:uncharacterized protein N7532_010701 [Penicillium argentinense]KAJ5085930.1 hypothetical protein N7532_010701 [Penicillium argentinense]
MVSPLIWAGVVVLARAASGDFVSTNYDEYNDGVLGHRPHLEYHSSTEFSPIFQATVWNSDEISEKGSHIFIRHDGNDTSPLATPLVIDAHDLSAVYMNRTFKNVFGTRVQENFGKKYLTFWEGEKGYGVGDGYGLAFDDTYRLAYKVWAQNIQVHSDLHEFAFTGNGTALVTGVNPTRILQSEFPQWNLPYNLDMLDAIFQEIDLETNEVIFNWRAIDHINPMDSFEPGATGWDAYHINSIEKTQAGNYLISIRHTHSILLIDGQTGQIIWTMGGERNDFVELPPSIDSENCQPVLSMSWQHHARFVPGTNETEMTFFDNHGKVTNHGDCDTECSRGLHIAINDTVSPPTVQLLREFRHPSQLQAQSQGSVQPLSPSSTDLGNVFIGWGRCPTFTEHNSLGETVMNVQFSPWHSDDIPDALDNYRAYKMDWTATPWWDPAIASRKNPQGELVFYVSWNGATEVTNWVVRGAATPSRQGHGNVLAKSSRTGFETKLVVGDTVWQYVWAEALDVNGNILRSSEVVDLDTADLVVAMDTYEANATLPFAKPTEKAETKTESGESFDTKLILLGTALAVFSTVGLVTCIIWVWQRCRGYEELKAEDFDLGSEHEDDERKSSVPIDDDDNDDRMGANNDARSRSSVSERPLLPIAQP